METLRADFVKRFREGLNKRVQEENKIYEGKNSFTDEFVKEKIESYDKVIKSDIVKQIMDGEEK